MAGILAAIAVALSLRSGAVWAQGAEGLGPVELLALENAESVAVEAGYFLPLPGIAAVAGLSFEQGDSTIEAEILEREAARERYRRAKEAGRQAILLEQGQGGRLAQHVAALCPGATARVLAGSGGWLGRPVRIAVGATREEVEARERAIEPDPALALWAHARIRALERDPARARDGAELKREITALGLEHRLVSAYTSLVAVSERPTGCGAPALARGDAARAERLAQLAQGPRQDTIISCMLLDNSPIDAAVKRHMHQIRYAYSRRLRLDNALAGKIVIRFTLDLDGNVIAVEIKSSTLGDPALEQALVEIFRAMEFPPMRSQQTVVSYPIVFTGPYVR